MLGFHNSSIFFVVFWVGGLASGIISFLGSILGSPYSEEATKFPVLLGFLLEFRGASNPLPSIASI